jgi:hypothetical protein
MSRPAASLHTPQNPQDTLDRLRGGALAGATRLDLRGCALHALPNEVFGLADTLQVLDLSDNALTDLPAGLAGLHRLQVLFASGNPFTTLPTVLGRCPALQVAGFKACRIHATCPAATPNASGWSWCAWPPTRSRPWPMPCRPACWRCRSWPGWPMPATPSALRRNSGPRWPPPPRPSTGPRCNARACWVRGRRA